MKKLFTLAALLLVALTVSCTGAGSGERVYVYNWGDYIDADIIKDFEKETGIRVIYETYDTNESMYAKLKPGNSSYDVAFPSDYMIERMINENMLEKIDMKNVPNFKNIDDKFKGFEFDKNDEYCVAYMWGTVGILYNTEMVDDDVESWDILWDEKYAGQIYMYDSMRDTFGAALKKTGFSVNTRSLEERTIAKNELIRQEPLVQAYIGDQVKDKMIGREGALAIVYSGDAMFCKDENDELEYVIPIEGSNLWYDGAVIPRGAKNKLNAEKFIDFICRPDIAARNTEYIGYSTPNKAAFELLDDEMKNDPTYWPDDEILINCEVFYDLGDFITEYDRAWTEILAN